VAPAANLNMVGRLPLMMGLIILFLAGKSAPTMPPMFSKRKDSGFPYGCAEAAAADGRRGSNVYKVSLWLWSFACGKPRLGGLRVEKTSRGRQQRVKQARSVRLRTVGVARLTKPDSK
jgi:hypothetical protein